MRRISLLIIVIVAATLFACVIFITPSKAANPLPPEVQSEINEAIKNCDGKVKFEKGFLTGRDVNGDGIEDFILDYGHFICGQSSTYYCGTADCLTQVFASLPDGKFVKSFELNVRGIKFEAVHGRPAILLDLHVVTVGKLGPRLAMRHSIGTEKNSLRRSKVLTPSHKAVHGPALEFAVRSGPGSQYRRFDELHNGEIVIVFESRGKWAGIVYRTPNATCHSTKTHPVPYGKKGWVHTDWLKDVAG